ncbi:MAG TPA: T9SS type A sorting domain-containing protein [candidate division WOR-3 bacterium]|uniref:T9SS type A sorting domain-containing protein n=1 Tax=candidate division WOR-3 bacterium TaxID=2052148 RepID=A0A7V0XF35_UNCW3|nr:T9SS type A sorting domain-containing protein [candidate division WOR-3 bacterium]
MAGVKEEAGSELARDFTAGLNPVHGRSVVRFTLGRETRVSLRVHDAAGRLVAELADGTLAAGEHTRTWNAAGVPAGVYYCTLSADGRSETRPLVITR